MATFVQSDHPVLTAASSATAEGESSRLRFAAQDLAAGLADARGIPHGGRAQEAQMLEAAGYRNLAYGRLFEGHVNVLQLIARLGSAEQRRLTAAAVARGELFGLWNTEAADGVRVAREDRDGIILSGRKTFCSGAPTVDWALISARLPSGQMQLVLIDMRRERPRLDPSFWQPMGMQDSESFAVDFTDARVYHREVIGAPDAYATSPWFDAGAWRFLAVQTGGLRRLTDEYIAWLQAGKRELSELVTANVGACVTEHLSCSTWIDRCVAVWQQFDNGSMAAKDVCVMVDAARVAVERAALQLAERIERGVGARGLLEPAPFARQLCDLRMYLRQPAPDQALLRVGAAALAARQAG